MNLWINSHATHWTGSRGRLHSVYFVMYGGVRVSRKFRNRDRAMQALERFAQIMGMDT